VKNPQLTLDLSSMPKNEDEWDAAGEVSGSYVVTEDNMGQFLGLAVYLHPNSVIKLYDEGWYSISVIPLARNGTRLEYEVYAKKGLNDEKVEELIDLIRETERQVCHTGSLPNAGLFQPPKLTGIKRRRRTVIKLHQQPSRTPFMAHRGPPTLLSECLTEPNVIPSHARKSPRRKNHPLLSRPESRPPTRRKTGQPHRNIRARETERQSAVPCVC
jgi:hypothetical protein